MRLDPPSSWIVIPVLAMSIAGLARAAAPATRPVQQFAQSETDPSSPRRSRLTANKPDGQVVRIDVDQDGDIDLLEHWWNGKRARWIDENDDMQPTDSRGDMALDAVQIDRDGDGYYDGPEDLSIKWVDEDDDGRPDLQIFAANPRADARSVRSGTSHWMVFIDKDNDGVNGYVDWTTFEFRQANWRVPPTTSPTITIPPPNFSPDYMGDAIFLKEHYPPGVFTNVEYNWENPFAFYDFDDDGLTELSIRLLESPRRTGGTDENPVYSFEGFVNEAMGGWDLDNDSSKGNEFDFDMSFRFFSDPDGKRGGRIDYRDFRDPHPRMKAPKWVLDGKYFRFDNWRRIDHFVYITHDKCFDAMWNQKEEFGSCWFVFDEDDDDHRWERVEFQYPSTQPYSTKRWTYNSDRKGGLGGHPQADSLGDRGEWDEDNSGRGHIYIGRWDRKLHLVGAETGAWLVDRDARFWGSTPALGNSSPQQAPRVEEVVQYADTDNNGFFDRITFDYDGDETIDLTISLLEYKTAKDPHPDVRDTYDPGQLGWKGMHELFKKRANLSFQQSLQIYRAAWKKGFTSPRIDNYAFASSIGDRYNQAHWLREEIFRLIDRHLDNDRAQRDTLRRLHFLGDTTGMVRFIESLAGVPVPPATRPAEDSR